MKLIIFDIDGTLTQTNEIDSTCFTQAIKEILAIDALNTDWASYAYSTDSGLLQEIYQTFYNKLPTTADLLAVQQRFVTHLKRSWQANPACIAPVPGANMVFTQIKQLGDWEIGIATGGWQRSALFKLNCARIPHITLPKAYADDHIERTEIIKTTIREAQSRYNVKHYEKIVYVGDRPWDQHAARQLGINFIGVGDQFKQQTEDFWVTDYQDSSLLLNHLNFGNSLKANKGFETLLL